MSNILHIDRNTGAITVNQLTASRLLSTDGSKALVSSDLVSWIAGTANRVTVTDDGDGSVTLSLPQDIHTAATPQFARLGLSVASSADAFLKVGGSISGTGFKFALDFRPTITSSNLHVYGLYVKPTVTIPDTRTVSLCSLECAELTVSSGSGTFKAMSIKSPDAITGTVTNAYGVYINPINKTGITNAYGIYQVGADDINYFAGDVGLGTNSPAAKLDVDANIASNVDSLVHFKRAETYTAQQIKVLDIETDFASGDGGITGLHVDVSGGAGGGTRYAALFNGGNVGIGTTTPAARLDVDGDARFGDGTNYTEIKTDGEVNLHGTARVKQGIWVDANGIKAPGAKPATEISHGDLEIAAWQFANEGVAANQQSVSWSCRIPEPMDRTVAPTVSIGWSADGVSPGNCEWQLEYFWTGPDDDTTQAAEETLTQTTAASATANGMVLTTFTGINAPDASDICLHCRLTRLSASANDTINDTVELHGACLQFTCDKLGEAT